VWRRGGDQRPDRGPRALDVRELELDRAARAIRRGARARGQRGAAFAGLSGLADGRGSRRPRLRRADSVISPAGVPRPIIDKLNAAINKAIASQTFKDRFAMIGDEPAGGTPEEFAELIRADSAKWGEVVRRSGARLD
jgi:hypothetical protein